MKLNTHIKQSTDIPKFIIEYKEEKNSTYYIYEKSFANFESAQHEREKLLTKGFFEPRIKKI